MSVRRGALPCKGAKRNKSHQDEKISAFTPNTRCYSLRGANLHPLSGPDVEAVPCHSKRLHRWVTSPH